MKYKSTSYTYLCISGQNFCESDIFAKINIKPSSIMVGNIGTLFWKYRIDAKDSLEGLEFAIDELVNVFNGKTNELNELISTMNVYIKLFVVTHVKAKESGGIFLSKKTIKFLDTIQAEFGFEYYI